jgi:hypothetical protein
MVRRTKGRRETRNKLDSAEVLFQSQAFHAPRCKNIAQHAGVGAVYWRFGTRPTC